MAFKNFFAGLGKPLRTQGLKPGANEIYVFPHVPKCGGTSLLHNLTDTPLSIFIDYDAPVGPTMHRRNLEAQKLDYCAFKLIYGHFPIGRYRGSLRYKYIALVRDPISRAISEYLYKKWRCQMGYLAPGHEANKIAYEILDGKIDFIGYLTKSVNTTRVYKHFLGHWDSSRFSLVGNVESYDAFLEALSERLGHNLTNDKRERVASERLDLSKSEITKARELLAREYEWYNVFSKASV